MFTQEINKKNPRYLMEEWQTKFKCKLCLQGELFVCLLLLFFFSKITLCKRCSQGTVYHVINQLGPTDRRNVKNISSMSNQEQKKKTMQVPASGVCANHLRQTYAVTSSTRGWKSFPPWARLQNLGMNLCSSLLT